MAYNKCVLIGRVGKDPEVKTFENDNGLAKFSLATSKSYKDKQDEWQEITQWHNVVYRGKGWDKVPDRISKGDLVLVEGEVQYRSWETDGEKKYITEISTMFLRKLNKSEAKAQSEQAEEPKPEPAQSVVDDSTDDLPF